jgi:S1-C subfamily serine protease
MCARTLAGALVALVALVGSGCSDDDGGETAEGPRKVETTRVQVVEGLGREGRFDPEAIYRRLAPGVVTVISLFDGGASLLEDGGEGGQGSGFVIDGEGHVATNAHVVTTGRAPRTRRAKQVFAEFSDGNRVPAKVVGADPNADVALLKLDSRDLSLTPLELGSSRGLRVGEPVAAIGSPFGERQSLSIGVISALDRNIESLTAFQIGNAIQTDAAINPGNSGGPLLDAGGKVLGINAQIRSRSGGGEGVGFAIPVDAVRRSLRELREKGRVDYGYLGVTTQSLYPQLARRLDVGSRTGALVVDVADGSPADEAGIEAGDEKIDFQGQEDVPRGGDVIVSVNGRRLTRRDDLADLISAMSAGDRVRLVLLRGDERRSLEVKLGRRPDRPPEP